MCGVIYRGTQFAEGIIVADAFFSRLIGYMFRKSPHVAGILFLKSQSVQTTFMKFDLDIVFLDNQNKSIRILKNVKPWRFTKLYFKADKVLELPSGSLPPTFREGEKLDFVEI